MSRFVASLVSLAVIVASALAGCAEPPGHGDGIAEGTSPDLLPPVQGEQTRTFKDSFDLTIGIVSPVYAGPGHNCVFIEWDGPHVLVGGNVTMTWDADTPVTQQLGLGLRSRGHDQGEDGFGYAREVGLSPIRVDLSGYAPLEGTKRTVMFFYGTPEAGFGAVPPQEVTIDVELVYRGGEPIAEGDWVCN